MSKAPPASTSTSAGASASSTSPPTSIPNSPSIFAYQTRLLNRTSSVSGHASPSKRASGILGSTGSGLSSLASMSSTSTSTSTSTGDTGRGESPPSTPIRRNVAKMIAQNFDSVPVADARGETSAGKRDGGGHARVNRSVDLVRNRWEEKITEANGTSSTPRGVTPARRDTATSNVPASVTATATPPSFSSATSLVSDNTGTSTTTSSLVTPGRNDNSAVATPRTMKRNTISDITDLATTSAFGPAQADATPGSKATFRAQPSSISSVSAILSPDVTGDSSILGSASGRTPAMEDRLARAKANALKRREAKAAATAGGTGPASVGAESTAGAKASPPAAVTARSIVEPSSSTSGSSVKASPFGQLFEPPSTIKEAPVTPTSVPTRSNTHKSTGSVSSLASHFNVDPAATVTAPVTEVKPPAPAASAKTATPAQYIPSGIKATIPNATNSTLASAPPRSSLGIGMGLGLPPSKDKYGSISSTDRRRLGRHLPRIASGGEGWEEDTGQGRSPSYHSRIPSALGQPQAQQEESVNRDKATTTPVKVRARSTDVLAPSSAANVPVPTPAPTPTPSTITKRKSAYLSQVNKVDLPSHVGVTAPRPEVAGAEMKGLMNALGSVPARGGVNDEGEGVAGMSNRLRLSKSTLPPSASSRTLAPTPLPSRRLVQTNWMDRQRHALAAYEYLCHVGEAQQWIEGCLEDELGFGVTELEDGLVDGVVLGRLAQRLQDHGVVKNIYTEGKHRYKQTENINHFLRFIRSVGMPETFIFETTDLYNKRNVPKVIFSIHVLSHILARLGKAERIGNLVGQFEFTDEQLATTQKGLQGVAMPNFGEARNTLAKEASWEPEEPEESEDEKRDRLLLECEPSIIKLQCHLRGRLAVRQVAKIHAQLDLAQPIIARFQARSRGALTRRFLLAEHEQRSQLDGWSTSLQAAAKAHTARKRWASQVEAVRRSERSVVAIQTQVRGLLTRSRRSAALNILENSNKGITAFQAVCRGCLARQSRKTHRQNLVAPHVAESITSLQATLRGRLARQAAAKEQSVLVSQTPTFTSMQSHLRGALVRRRMRAREEKLDNATDHIVAIQATARGVLARKKKQVLLATVQTAFRDVPSIQALARGRLARKSHQTMQKALAKVEVAGSVGGLQAFLRTKLAKRQTTEQKKRLEFVSPDVIGFQSVARGYLARREYREWRDYLQDPHTQGALVFLQSLIRGFIARRKHWQRTTYIHRNVDKVVKIQALWRGRVERQTYSKLITGQDVDVPTIQNYMHLLDDTEADFTDQIRTETMRKEVMDLIRENQTLETEVKELDTKIALIVNNKMTFEELARVKRRAGRQDDNGHGGGAGVGGFHHSGNSDPFTSSGAHLDRASQRKLELYEHLFFTLQTKPEYLSRLLRAIAKDEAADKDRKVIERVTLILFGYERREEYLFHKLLQISVHEEILRSPSLDHLGEARLAITPVATQYIKPNLAPYLEFVLAKHVMRVIQATGLDLCTDPVELYQRSITAEETHTGLPTTRPRNLDADQVLQTDATARAEYIQHLQELRFLCDQLVKGLVKSTVQMPYTIRLLARESLLALRIKYPDAYDEDLTPIIARTVILPFILPAMIAPEAFGFIDQPIGPLERRNLAAIANLLTHIAAPDSAELAKDRFVRVPLQEYIKSDSPVFRDWIMDVADVEPLEGYFQAHEMLESTLESKPISITRNDIYGTLSILMRHIPILTAKKANDPIAKVFEELEGPPVDYDRSNNPIMLRLTNRFAEVKTGADSRLKEDWVQAKRHVLAVLRIQTGRTLFDVLTSRPEEIHERQWIQEVHRDIALEQARAQRRDLPPTPAEAEYQIESIRSLPFHEVKSRAIVYCMNLEKAGQISRTNHFQGLLVSIASDIRQKHHLRKMQKQNLIAMTRAHEDLSGKKKGFDEQIKSYHDYIDSSMASLQAKGKKKPMFLSKQYRHQRAIAREGKRAQFGSYSYTATELNEKGILLGIQQFSPRQYDKVTIIISSNEVGVFSIEMSTTNTNGDAIMGNEQIRMEDLLQAQFDNEQNLLLFEGMATFSINTLVHQINKKFYA